MPSKQTILIAGGVVCVVLTIRNAIKGRRSTYWGRMAYRQTTPVAFWFTIALDACSSIAFLTYAVMHRAH